MVMKGSSDGFNGLPEPNGIARAIPSGRSLILVAAYFLSACSLLSNLTVPAAGPLPSPTPSPHTLSLAEITVDEAMQHFQDPLSQETFEALGAITKSGLQGLHTFARFGPTIGKLTSGLFVSLLPTEGLVGYVLIVDTQQNAHEFGLLATLDYQPIQINFNGALQSLPVVRFVPGRWRAFQFSLSPLPEGLYTLVITNIIEPHHTFLLRADPLYHDPAEAEALGLRVAPQGEFGVLIWVNPDPPQTALDWPEKARAFPPDQTALVSYVSLQKEVPSPGEPMMLLMNKDTVRAGETKTYYVRMLAHEGEGDIPVRVMVFWDEMLTQAVDLTVPVVEANEQNYIPFPVPVPANLTEGTHTLTAIAYPYPYYLRWWGDGSEWSPNVTFLSHLMARLPVSIERPP